MHIENLCNFKSTCTTCFFMYLNVENYDGVKARSFNLIITLFFFSSDIDECSQSESVCTKEHQECVNTKGSYVCICLPGYEEKDDECVQISEPGELVYCKIKVC